MSRFEVKEVYISDVVLNESDYTPKRKLNIQVELNFEAQQNLRDAGPSPEELAKELGDTVAKAFSKTTVFTGSGATMEKKEIVIRPTEGVFGWYELDAYNRKIAEETERAYKEYQASK